jgi:uncharacterized protein (TIGR00375 family)
VHHLIYAPTFEAADRITGSLAKVGNLASDGRPILGLDSRDLLEITLQAGPGCHMVPAHIWTPWFAVLGSRSGFEAVADCYDDLAAEIFAVETGLSPDPRMNWMCSSLDGYQLVSNSDAHSPPMLGREATTFTTAMDFFSIAEALRTGDGLAGTIEFYPEEGKYHLNGYRKCGIRPEPEQTRERDGVCPECHKPLTAGVLHRVAELADRPDGHRPDGAADFNNLVPLAEIISEILSVGPKSKTVNAVIDGLVAAFGPELAILRDVPAKELARVGGSPLTEAITRLRRGEVIKDAGYDGNTAASGCSVPANSTVPARSSTCRAGAPRRPPQILRAAGTAQRDEARPGAFPGTAKGLEFGCCDWPAGAGSGAWWRRGYGPQVQQHPRVAQGVRLHPVQAEKFGDTLVVGPQQFGVDVGRDRRAEDLGEAKTAEEGDREGQDEHALHAELAGLVKQRMRDPAPDSVPLAARTDRDGPDLGQVLPQDVQCSAADDEAVGFLFRDPEFLHVLVQRDGGLAEQAPGVQVRVDQRADPRDVGGTRRPDPVSHRGSTIAGVTARGWRHVTCGET